MLEDPLFIVVGIACLIVLGVLLTGIGGFAKGGESHHALSDLRTGRRHRADPAFCLSAPLRGINYGRFE
jgi:hypothetical protein